MLLRTALFGLALLVPGGLAAETRMQPKATPAATAPGTVTGRDRLPPASATGARGRAASPSATGRR